MIESNQDDAPSEHELLAAWALRFDGYAYRAATGFVLSDATDAYVDRGVVPDDPLQRLAVLFAMQRWLGKWGGERELENGPAWQAFRRLFLITVDVEIPPEFRFMKYHDQWARTPPRKHQQFFRSVRKHYEAIGAIVRT